MVLNFLWVVYFFLILIAYSIFSKPGRSGRKMTINSAKIFGKCMFKQYQLIFSHLMTLRHKGTDVALLLCNSIDRSIELQTQYTCWWIYPRSSVLLWNIKTINEKGIECNITNLSKQIAIQSFDRKVRVCKHVVQIHLWK